MSLSIPTLIEEMKSDDCKKRLNSLKHLNSIALALGPERTRSELIPFLSTEIMDDDDEILAVLAESLGNLTENIGGIGFNRAILPLLETLCQIADNLVREKTIGSMKKLLPKNEDYFIGMAKRFVSSEYYSCKMVSIELIPILIENSSLITQSELISLCKIITKDPLPMVRKHFSLNFQNLLKVLQSNSFEKDILEIVQTLLKDDEDFVRFYLVEALINLSNYLTISKHKDTISSYFNILSNDIAWRIKYMICDKVLELGQSFGKDLTKSSILPAFLKFLQHEEPELRSIATARLDKIGQLVTLKLLDVDILIQKICPMLKPLSNDPLVFVRTSLASSILSLSTLIGKKGTNEFILPVFLTLLKDDEIDVRIALLRKLGDILKIIGIEALSQSIIPAFVDLGMNNNWRNRLVAVEQVVFYAKQMGEPFFNEKTFKVINSWINDRIFAVREATINIMPELIESLGLEWLFKDIVGKYLILSKSSNYLFRQTLLFFIQKIAKSLKSEIVIIEIYPTVIELSKDPIANVRINSAKALKSLYLIMGEKEKEQIKNILKDLTLDEDWDVKVISKQLSDSIE